MPLDDWMPGWDARSAHQISIAASPAIVYQTLVETDFGANPVVRALMGLRTIPALLMSPRKTWNRIREARGQRREGPHGNLLSGAFVPLELAPQSSIILGLTGRFWTPAGTLIRTEPERFRDQIPAGLARATWSFHLDPAGSATRLRTETRVRCADRKTRRRFLLYWSVIQGASGMIRRALLWQIKRKAEATARSGPRP